MNRVYQDAIDKNVATVVIFSNNGSYYYDEAKTKEVPAKDMLNLFMKGVVAFDGTTYTKAVSCTAAGVISFGEE